MAILHANPDRYAGVDNLIKRQEECLSAAGINLGEGILPPPSRFDKLILDPLDRKLYEAIEREICTDGSFGIPAWTYDYIENWLSCWYIGNLDEMGVNKDDILLAFEYYTRNSFYSFGRASFEAEFAIEYSDCDPPWTPEGMSLESASLLFGKLSEVINSLKLISFYIYIAHDNQLRLGDIVEFFSDPDEGGSSNPEPWLNFIDSLDTCKSA